MNNSVQTNDSISLSSVQPLRTLTQNDTTSLNNKSNIKSNIFYKMNELDPFSAGYYRQQASRNVLSAFPWDLRLPPCKYQISSFSELDAYMNKVPLLNEAYKLTYHPSLYNSEQSKLSYDIFQDFMAQYSDTGSLYIKHLQKFRLPKRITYSILYLIANLRGLAFLFTLYFAYADIYRTTNPKAVENQIVEDFLKEIENGFPYCTTECTYCIAKKY